MSNDIIDDGATPVVVVAPIPEVAPVAEPKPTETVEFWKTQARENEKRAKANADAAKELDKLRAASMTDLERVVAETKSETRIQVLREVGSDRAADHMRLSAAGRAINVEALLDGLDLTRFSTDDGQPDVKKIAAFIDGIAPAADPKDAPVGRVPAGVRDSGKSGDGSAQDFAKFINGQLR